MLAVVLLTLSLLEVSDTLHTSVVQASFKEPFLSSIQKTEVGEAFFMDRGAVSLKDLSGVAPNFFQPRYGSRTTSSIYVRGLGSRIDTPVAGLYVDGIPLMNKSSFDFDFPALRSVSVLRGPQGSLYGRNTSGGVVLLHTLTPFEDRGLTLRLGASLPGAGAFARYAVSDKPSRAWSLEAAFDYDGGAFVNEYTGRRCDWSRGLSLRSRQSWRGQVSVDNTISASLSDEGGYAYARIGEDGKSIGINYNDPCGYRRLNVWDGATVRWGGEGHESSLTASWQLLADDMALDNDFTALSLFSMHQKQLENAFTLEYQFRRAQPTERWNYLFGAFAFGRFLNLTAPVLFQRDGIEQLILAGANRGIQTVFPDAEMMIAEDSFPISSDFFLPSAGLALFHHSTFRFGRWRLDAGLRADFDYSAMSYDSEALIHYSLKTIQDDYLPLRTVFEGFESKPSFQVLPSLSLTYQLDFGHFQACISRGHKAGGFNTQIFSDILQNRMMSDMVEGLGFHLKDQGGDSGSAAATSYLPEYHWNFELGGVWTPSSAASLSLTAFCILSRNLQVTVMPHGLGTGRLMSNAARARSLGLEASGRLSAGEFRLDAAYGLALARFEEYRFSDSVSYEGKYVPYAPRNTACVTLGYEHPFRNDRRIRASVTWNGVGRIWWDEANTAFQPFYSLLDAKVGLTIGHLDISIWGSNLLNTGYGTFRFRSVGRDFIAVGRPICAGLLIKYSIL